jgi:hypothetical protein
MTVLQSIVEKYYPTEKIIAYSSIKLIEEFSPFKAILVTGSDEIRELRNVDMIETNSKLFFDCRDAVRNYWMIKKWRILFTPIIEIICFVIGVYAFQILAFIPVWIFVLILMVQIINYGFLILSVQGFNHIKCYEKSWISDSKNENGYIVLRGKIPTNIYADIIYSDVLLRDLSFFDKMSRGFLPSSLLKSFSIGGEFILKYAAEPNKQQIASI